MQSAHVVLYSHTWSVGLYHILPHYPINVTTFEKKIIEYKIYFDFLYKFCVKQFKF